jgi:hypothetical protein
VIPLWTALRHPSGKKGQPCFAPSGRRLALRFRTRQANGSQIAVNGSAPAVDLARDAAKPLGPACSLKAFEGCVGVFPKPERSVKLGFGVESSDRGTARPAHHVIAAHQRQAVSPPVPALMGYRVDQLEAAYDADDFETVVLGFHRLACQSIRNDWPPPWESVLEKRPLGLLLPASSTAWRKYPMKAYAAVSEGSEFWGRNNPMPLCSNHGVADRFPVHGSETFVRARACEPVPDGVTN